MELESIDTILLEIRYQGDNNFIIARFQSGRKVFTAKGPVPSPEISGEYRLFGKWVEDPRYGRQFDIAAAQFVVPVKAEGILRFLTRSLKGIGPITAARLVEKFGEKAIEVIRDGPERAANAVQGLRPEVARDASAFLIENEYKATTLLALEDLIGWAGPAMVQKVFREWKGEAPEIVRSSPYRLCDIGGIGFMTADAVAMKLGKPTRDPERIHAAMRHIMKEEIFSAGNTWMKIADAVRRATDMLAVAVNPETAVEGIETDGEYMTLKSFASAERFIAAKLCRMAHMISGTVRVSPDVSQRELGEDWDI